MGIIATDSPTTPSTAFPSSDSCSHLRSSRRAMVTVRRS